MNEEISITCPYCGESMLVEPDPSEENAELVEDCQVCCRPVVITLHYSVYGSQATARREND